MGSYKRKPYRPNLTKTPHFRASDEETEWMKAQADKDGQSFTAYLRGKCLGEFFELKKKEAERDGFKLTISASKKRKHAPHLSLEYQTLAQILGDLRKTNGNLTRIANKFFEDNHLEADELRAAQTELKEIAARIVEVLTP